MKKWILYSLIVTVVCGGLSVIFAAMSNPEAMIEFGQRAGHVKFENVNVNVNGQLATQKLDVADIREFNIKSRSIDLHVVPSDDQFLYVEYMPLGEQPTEFPQNRNGHILTLDADDFVSKDQDWRLNFFGSKRQFGIQGEDSHVTVRVPKSVLEITAQTISGDIKIENISGDKLNADTVSGHIKTAGGAFRELNIKSVSGDVKSDLNVEKTDVQTVSGRVKIAVDKADARLNLGTMSGDVILDYSHEPDALLSFKTTSGAVKINTAQRMKVDGELESFKLGTGHGDVKIHTISGSARISLQDRADD